MRMNINTKFLSKYSIFILINLNDQFLYYLLYNSSAMSAKLQMNNLCAFVK